MPSINVSIASRSNKVRRDAVKPGEVFRVKGGDELYAHLGNSTIPPRRPGEDKEFRSLNLRTKDLAFTKNGKSTVEVVGTWSMQVDLHNDYANLARKVAA